MVTAAIGLCCTGRSVYIRRLTGANDNPVGFDQGQFFAYRQCHVRSKLPCFNARFFKRNSGITGHTFQVGTIRKILFYKFLEPEGQCAGAIITGKYFRARDTACQYRQKDDYQGEKEKKKAEECIWKIVDINPENEYGKNIIWQKSVMTRGAKRNC